MIQFPIVFIHTAWPVLWPRKTGHLIMDYARLFAEMVYRYLPKCSILICHFRCILICRIQLIVISRLQQRNYQQIKQEVRDIIETEMEKILNDPARENMVVKK